MQKINKSMTIEQIVTEWPQTVGPLTEMGVRCFVCGEPTWGTLEESALEKGLTNIDEIVDKLNALIAENQRQKV